MQTSLCIKVNHELPITVYFPLILQIKEGRNYVTRDQVCILVFDFRDIYLVYP